MSTRSLPAFVSDFLGSAYGLDLVQSTQSDCRVRIASDITGPQEGRGEKLRQILLLIDIDTNVQFRQITHDQQSLSRRRADVFTRPDVDLQNRARDRRADL